MNSGVSPVREETVPIQRGRSLRWFWSVFALFFLVLAIKGSPLADDPRWYTSAFAVIAGSLIVYAAYGDTAASSVRKVTFVGLWAIGQVVTLFSLQTSFRLAGLILVVGATVVDVWLIRRQPPHTLH